MDANSELTLLEAADRLAIRELFAPTPIAPIGATPRGTHFNGQSTVTIDGDRATGESYTMPTTSSQKTARRMIMIASLRYLDMFAKIEGSWYFAERKLLLDWSETRPSTPEA